jgi:hypothetical protein
LPAHRRGVSVDYSMLTTLGELGEGASLGIKLQ